MPRKRINIVIDTDLNDRWNIVAKKIKMSKSSMLASMLENSLPVLEKNNTVDMISQFYADMAKVTKDVGSLFYEE